MHGGHRCGSGGPILQSMFVLFIATCSLIGLVGHPRVVGRRDRAGWKALGKGLGSPNCSSHHDFSSSFSFFFLALQSGAL